ncbi:hypothetical protein LTR84_000204 [Exophiala bonariae]|uniref:Uncharacterized protein n=1 Tax=Exophiala bonariae TaxID=1690606 RepID=A0AAV9NPX2_9EURO|nr:hypothetical protein LTR84_000204 [Exophiala bonariae]
MGGHAFPSAHTPRMPENVYRSVLEHVESRLKEHFEHVGHAIEGPEKFTHGDIDVFVATPINPSHLLKPPGGQFLADIIQGKQFSKPSGGSSVSILIDWPEEFASEIPTLNDDEEPQDSTGNTKSAHIQVDLTICSNSTGLEWLLFLHAHGDLWAMLGGIIRRLGLTNSHKGLAIRIEETEGYNKERSRVTMTNDPYQVLRFLGLNIERYFKPFSTLDEMMSYVTTCRFHDPRRGAGKPREGLKSNERQRANKRAAYTYWVDEYLPAHQNDPCRRDAHKTRDEVIEIATRFFDLEFTTRYDEQKKKIVHEFRASNMWSEIRKSIPTTGNELGRAMKGLKAVILATNSEVSPGGDDELQKELYEVRIAFLEGRFDEVQAWSSKNWRLVGGKQTTLEGIVPRTSLKNAHVELKTHGLPIGGDVMRAAA